MKSCVFLSLCLCRISADFGEFHLPFAPRRNSLKSAEISQTQRKEYTRLQVRLFQFISHYSPKIQVLILYHRNPIQTLVWHPIAWASCAELCNPKILTEGS